MNNNTYKLQDGDYVKEADEKEFQTVESIDAIVQCVSAALRTQREKFYPDKNFGSHIRSVLNGENAERVLVYARQAVESFDGVYVKNAVIKHKNLIADLMINGVERSVCICFEADL